MAVDPEVPAEVADLFRRNGSLLSRIRAGWTPEPRLDAPGLPVRALQVAGAVAALLLLAGAFRADDGRIFIFVPALLLFVAFTGHLAAREGPLESEDTEQDVYRNARWYEDRYLLPEDFDAPAEELRERTRKAVEYVLRSQVNASRMLDDARNSVMLPAQEWEIARLLAKLSALRDEHDRLGHDARTPEVAAAMAPLERALAASEAAVVARVEALERYAGHVAEAERAFRAHQQIELLRSRLPRYEELLAETGADALAVPEIDHLAQDAGRLERALRESVRSAHEAFRYLDGPSTEGDK
ncbi:hypothetical protein GCM10014719_14470 [Planomonospora parontospora subsp. antibiotica]|nr:hypothetical protein GCM10014719_14470 [Planomonospora parontospora subsp. antibiotica]GII13892.1 hypothetical protein Ppa05_06180 [Planomonospora parontospora subsp. antibiotica]